MKQTGGRTHAIGGGKPGPGKPSDGKHFTGQASNANAHPKFGKGPVVGSVGLNGGMDPGTQVSHAAAQRSSRNIPRGNRPVLTNNRFSKRK